MAEGDDKLNKNVGGDEDPEPDVNWTASLLLFVLQTLNEARHRTSALQFRVLYECVWKGLEQQTSSYRLSIRAIAGRLGVNEKNIRRALRGFPSDLLLLERREGQKATVHVALLENCWDRLLHKAREQAKAIVQTPPLRFGDLRQIRDFGNLKTFLGAAVPAVNLDEFLTREVKGIAELRASGPQFLVFSSTNSTKLRASGPQFAYFDEQLRASGPRFGLIELESAELRASGPQFASKLRASGPQFGNSGAVDIDSSSDIDNDIDAQSPPPRPKLKK